MKKIASLVLVTSLLTACGPGPSSTKPEGATGLTIDCLQNVTADIEIDPQILQDNVKAVQRLMVVNKLLPTEDSFCQRFGAIPVHILADLYFNCNDKGCMIGFYDSSKGITLGSDTDAMMHEYLHAYDMSFGNALTAQHFLWKERGFYALSDQYSHEQQDPSRH